MSEHDETNEATISDDRALLPLLESSASDNNTRRTWMTIRIEQYAETPPPMKGLQEPTDIQYLRMYRMAHESDWLTCTVGHIRIYI